MKNSKDLIFPIVIVSIAPIILLSPLLISGRVLFWGTVSLQFFPWRMLVWDLLKSGQLPLWNDLSGMGAPLLANYQSAIFYPPNWLLFILASLGGTGLAAWGQTLVVAFNMILGGIGMVLFIRRIGLGIPAQTICGMMFGLSGYLVSRSGFMSINAAVSWLPWVLYTVTELTTKRSTFIRVMKSVIVFSLLLMAGHAQTAWYIILLAFFWVVYLGVVAELRGKSSCAYQHKRITVQKIAIRLLKNFGLVFLGLLLATGFAAVQILPTAELFLLSQRANAVAYENAMTYSFWPWRFLTLFTPIFFGSPATGDYWGYGNYWEDHLYIGLMPIVLAFFAMLSLFIGKKNGETLGKVITSTKFSLPLVSLVVFLVALIIISFVLALGNNTPIYPWLYANIPTFSLFQAPTRISIWAEFALIVLAGIGVDRLRRLEGKALYWTRLATAGSFAIALGGGIAWFFLGNISPTFLRGIAQLSFFSLCTGLLVLANPQKKNQVTHDLNNQRIWNLALITLIGIDLLVAGWGLNPGVNRDFYVKTPPSVSELREILDGGRLYLSTEDEYSLKFNRFMRFDTFSIEDKWQNLRSVVLPNLNILDGISSVNNFDPLLTARYARWIQELDALQLGHQSNEILKLYNLMGVGVVERIDPGEELGVSYTMIEGSRRIRWVACAIPVSTADEAWELVFDGNSQFDHEVVIEGLDMPEHAQCKMEIKSPRTSIVDEETNSYSVRVDSRESGWLVISDLWYPGWQARIDGEPVRIYNANYLFRAVNLPAGEHEVVFIYRPLTFWVGFYISLLFWTITGVLYAGRGYLLKRHLDKFQ